LNNSGGRIATWHTHFDYTSESALICAICGQKQIRFRVHADNVLARTAIAAAAKHQ
jgi:hypothetical protein